VNSPLKPPIVYFGSKQTIADQIVAFFPEHDHYVEPFAGSLAVLLAKKPSKMETVNDLDEVLVTFWRVLRDRPEDLARACALTPHSRVEYSTIREAGPAGDELEIARRVWVLLTQGRAGTLRKPTGWRHFVVPRGSSIGMPSYLDGYLARMLPAAERLRQASLEALPALDLIAKYGADPETLLYVDPPYAASTRAPGQYKHELETDDEHRELAEALTSCKAAVVLSGYPSELYDQELYPDWSRVEIASMTGNGVNGEKARTEVLWSNRPIGQPTLFDVWGAA
jgi:DNA adenine methylase